MRPRITHVVAVPPRIPRARYVVVLRTVGWWRRGRFGLWQVDQLVELAGEDALDLSDVDVLHGRGALIHNLLRCHAWRASACEYRQSMLT